LKNLEHRHDERVHELAAQLGISDLEKFLRACLANSAVMGGMASSILPGGKVRYTIDEAAELLGVSPRWLADECRAERIEHVHLARHRFFTFDQLLRLLKKHEVEPLDVRVDRELERVKRRIQRDRLSNGQRRG
jgi:hypothetical protein